MRKARIYQFTQNSYDQNKKATIHKMIGAFSLNKIDQVYPNIAEVDQTYGKPLDHDNKIDDTQVDFPDSCMSNIYSVFTNNEATNTLKELKRATADGIDKIRTQNLKSIPISHTTAIMNY